MTGLFLSTSFTAHTDKTGIIIPAYKAFIEQLLANLRDDGTLSVFCALEYENWKISEEPPEVSIRKDVKEIEHADALLALLPKGTSSGGVQFEIGLAYALGKKVFLATESDAKLAFFNQGAINAGYMTHIRYKNPQLLAQQITQAI